MAIAKGTTGTPGRIGKFLRSSRGNATLITTLAAIPMIGCVGLAVDYMRGVRASEALQSVADAAALAAASATNVSGSTSEQLSQRAVIASNYINDSVAKVSDIELVGSPAVTTGPNTIDIQVDAKVKGSFINVLNALKDNSAETGNGGLGDRAGEKSSKDIDLSVHSKVGFSDEAYLCLLSMNMTQTEAIYFQGNSKFMASCSVHANSNATTAIRTWGNAEAYAASFCARGGWAGSGFDPDPEGGCSVVQDPFGTPGKKHYLTLPTAGGCTATNKQIKNNDVMATLAPGTYCGGISVVTHGKLTLQKGVYILKDGDLKVDSQSELYAPDGTVIYLTGNSSNVDISSGATVHLVAPNKANSIAATEPYRGWAIMQDRESGIGNTNSIYSKGGVNIRGGIYTPAQKLVVWANGDMNADSDYFPMVVDTLNMNGTATLYVNLDWGNEHLDEPDGLKQAGKIFVSQ